MENYRPRPRRSPPSAVGGERAAQRVTNAGSEARRAQHLRVATEPEDEPGKPGGLRRKSRRYDTEWVDDPTDLVGFGRVLMAAHPGDPGADLVNSCHAAFVMDRTGRAQGSSYTGRPMLIF